MKKLLIAGIDPGTTLGYALLDLNGNVVKIGSSKQLDMGSLMVEMIKEGKVIIVGTDKSRTPKFVERAASQTGARVIRPKEDMSVEDKREVTKGYDFSNEHEKDALAAAIYAFKRTRKLMTKIDVYLKKHDKEGIADEVKEIMLRDKRVRIHEAVDMVEKPEEIKNVKVKRKRTGKTKDKFFEEIDEENPKKDTDAERKLEMLKQRMRAIIRTKMRKLIRIKNQKIDFLTKKTREQEEEIIKLKESIERLNRLIIKADKNLLLKKIKNLSWEEIEKEKLDKIIYVEDPNVFSEKSLEKIKENVDVVVSKKEMSKKVSEKFKVMFINTDRVDAQDEGDIILINKEKLEKEKSKVDILKKVIEEYRENRK